MAVKAMKSDAVEFLTSRSRPGLAGCGPLSFGTRPCNATKWRRNWSFQPAKSILMPTRCYYASQFASSRSSRLNCHFLKPLDVVVSLTRAMFGLLYQSIIAPLWRRC